MPAMWLLVILAVMIAVGAGVVWVALRGASHAGGNRELAVTLTTQAVKMVQENPGSVPIRDQAEGTYREAIEADSTYAVPRNNLGRILFEKGQVDEAVTQLRAAVRLDPENAAAHANLADALEARGNRDAAETAYRAAVRLDRAHKVPAAPNNLALLLIEAGKGKEALAVLERAESDYPVLGGSAAFWKNYGLALRASGREAGADSAFARGAAIDPAYMAVKAGEAADRGDVAAARALWLAVSEASDPGQAARAREALKRLGDAR